MSFFGKMFGGKAETVMTTGEAIQNLRETENMLIKKQEFLEKKIEQEIETAKKNGSKNKRAAIQALKRKKRFMQQLQQIDGTLSTIEMQREALEDANQNTATITTMKKAAEALKKAHQNLDTDKIHDIMDDIGEQQDVANEISQAISTPIGGFNYDEDELEKELQDLEQEQLDEDLLSTGTHAHELPEVPNGDIKAPAVEENKKVPIKSIEDDDDMKTLLSWAN
ncbi:charged multivesicular body protein 4b-like [Sitodiplosis mosellana]|uniref:charged multivesicular body protein 4b-like n=1 Tax=Sitodiplosis mosellana TaxID=263140 RepID=UPI002444B0E9|nr:charged multivesicular body protein 4b-like [Sitodiplosis mosellana]